MSKAPAMPFFWDAYLADTTHLTTEEHGAYLLLLAAMWRRDGSVPNDDKDNARIVGVTIAKWRKIKTRLSPFLEIEKNTISQKNLRKIWKNTQEKIRKNVENGRKGGIAKSNKNNNLAEANATNSLKRKATIPEPEPYIDSKLSIIYVEKEKKHPCRFDEFWDAFSDKRGKAPALKVWQKNKLNEKADVIISGAKRYADFRSTDPTKCKMAQGWLSDERWTDEIRSTQGKPNATYSKNKELGDDITRFKKRMAKRIADIEAIERGDESLNDVIT